MRRSLSATALLVTICLTGNAYAADWSAETCSHLQEIKSDIRKSVMSDYGKASQMMPILTRQVRHCVKYISPDLLQSELDNAGSQFASEKKRRSVGGTGLNCITVPMAGGGGMTNCN
jgi:hypothetical protein